MPGGQRAKGEGVGVTVMEGEGDCVRLVVGLRLGVRVGVGVGVHVEAGVGEPVGVEAGVAAGVGVGVGVPVGEAPGDRLAVEEGVGSAVRVVDRVPVGVRVGLAVGVREALAEGKHTGGAPSSMRRMRLFKLSAIKRLEPAMARPQGELNFAEAAGPSASPPPPAVREPTATAGAVTSATTRILWFMLSAM